MKSTDHPEKDTLKIKQENNGDSSISDVEVIRECIEEKNQNSCNEFMRRYFEKVSRLVRRITKNQLDTQDVVQDVFLKVIEKIDTYRGLSKFSTWVYKITENTSFNYLRANTKYNKSLSFEDNMFFNTDEYNITTLGYNSELKIGPESIVLKKEILEKIENAVNELPLNYREVFKLRDIEGLSYEEISNELGISVTTLKVRLHRAREKLRKKLSDHVVDKKAMNWLKGKRGINDNPPLF